VPVDTANIASGAELTDLTGRLTDFVAGLSYADLPAAVLTSAKLFTLECIGHMVAGLRQPVGQLVAGYVGDMGAKAEASVLGAGFQTTVAEAAYARVALHCPLSPLALAASLQLDACLPNFLVQEHNEVNDWREGGHTYSGRGYLKEPFVLDADGCVAEPQGPGLGVELGLLPERGRDLVLAGAIISILVNPIVFAAVDRLVPRPPGGDGVTERAGVPGSSDAARGAGRGGHLILVGYGGVGRSVARGLRERGETFVVIEDADDLVETAQADGMPLVVGHAATPHILAAADVTLARKLLIAIPNVFESGQIVEHARAASPSLTIVARADSVAEAEHLAGLGADVIVERRAEIARGLLAHAGAEGRRGMPPPAPD